MEEGGREGGREGEGERERERERERAREYLDSSSSTNAGATLNFVEHTK